VRTGTRTTRSGGLAPVSPGFVAFRPCGSGQPRGAGGLTEDDARAKEQYEWVVAHAPATAHATLVARQYLGGILLRKRQCDQALAQFEAIYAADPDAVETPPAEAAIVPKAEPVATQILRLQVRAVDLMVAACRAKRGAAAVTALKALIEKYRDDAFVRETAEEALEKAEQAATARVSDEEGAEGRLTKGNCLAGLVGGHGPAGRRAGRGERPRRRLERRARVSRPC
jgi:hypothetical protein